MNRKEGGSGSGSGSGDGTHSVRDMKGHNFFGTRKLGRSDFAGVGFMNMIGLKQTDTNTIIILCKRK